MSKSNSFESSLVALIFNGTAIANLADNAASGPLTNLYLSLHTSDPGEAGSQATNECAYTSYARVAVARTSGGWTVSGGVATLVDDQHFPAATGGSETATHFGVGTAASGAGVLLYSGTLDVNIPIATPTAPYLKAGTTITED